MVVSWNFSWCFDCDLVGDWNMTGLCFHSVGNVIIPIDELIFFRGVGIPPTRLGLNCCVGFGGSTAIGEINLDFIQFSIVMWCDVVWCLICYEPDFLHFSIVMWLVVTGTWLLFFHILGMSSSQLTHIFQRGRYTTNQWCCVMFDMLYIAREADNFDEFDMLYLHFIFDMVYIHFNFMEFQCFFSNVWDVLATICPCGFKGIRSFQAG